MITVSRSGLTIATNAAPRSPTTAGQRLQMPEDVRADAAAAVDCDEDMSVLLLLSGLSPMMGWVGVR
jgi:hypothetical protein